MIFSHHDDIWTAYPGLRAAVLHIVDVDQTGDTSVEQENLIAEATTALSVGAESDLAPIKAWRQTFSAMGYKPTQYRCASESLLRRLRRQGDLPTIHPLVDLCNALSVAWAVPVAAFDVAKIQGSLTVGKADGQETYHAFSGELEHPEPGEVIFRDDNAVAHARRWAHRQSALSAIAAGSGEALVVAEGFHEGAEWDLTELADRLTAALSTSGTATVKARALLIPSSRAFVVSDA